MKPSGQMGLQQPMVGIFWLLGKRLILDVSPLSRAEASGDWLDHSMSHDEFWTAQQRVGAVPLEIEYLEPPRGRVLFNTKTKRYMLYADRCILKKKFAVKQIIKAMHLPSKQTDVATDGPEGHYRCSRCIEAAGLSKDNDWD